MTTLFRREDYIGHRQGELLAILQREGPLTTPQIIKLVYANKRTSASTNTVIRTSLYALEERGLISRTKVPVTRKRPRCGANRHRPEKTVNEWYLLKNRVRYRIRKKMVDR